LLEDASGTIDCGFRIFNTEGNLVNEILLLAKYGADRIVWHRQDLHSYLMKAATSTERAGPAAVIRTNSRVISCDCEAGTVVLQTQETLTADLVVGADGINSNLRTTILGREIPPKPTGSSCYRLMMSSQSLHQRAPQFAAAITPEDSYTSMIMAMTVASLWAQHGTAHYIASSVSSLTNACTRIPTPHKGAPKVLGLSFDALQGSIDSS
jgi:salicylate hydroxylase